MSTFEETAHPRGTAGKFTAKTMPEADGGTEAELTQLPREQHHQVSHGQRVQRRRAEHARQQAARREVPNRLRATSVSAALRKAGLQPLASTSTSAGMFVREDLVDKALVRVLSTSNTIASAQIDRAQQVLDADGRFDVERVGEAQLHVRLKRSR